LDLPRLPHSPAEISANWKQLIQVGKAILDVLITAYVQLTELQWQSS